MSMDDLNFSLLPVTAIRSGCFGTWLRAKLHVSDSEADLNLLHGAPHKEPLIKQMQMALLDAQQPIMCAQQRAHVIVKTIKPVICISHTANDASKFQSIIS